MKTSRTFELKIAALFLLVAFVPFSSVVAGPLLRGNVADVASLQAPGPEHKHEWKKEVKQVWVPPKYQKQLVGYDKNGKPIYKDVLVKKGEYKNVTYYRCTKCGATK